MAEDLKRVGWMDLLSGFDQSAMLNLRLDYSRREVDDRFIDELSLKSTGSDVASVALEFADPISLGSVEFIPLIYGGQGPLFFKRHEGSLYASSLNHVVCVGQRVLQIADRFLDETLMGIQMVGDVSVSGLDYFHDCGPRGIAALPFGSVYNTGQHDTHSFKQWVEDNSR